MVSHERLGLPAELASRFAAWIQRYWARADRKPFDTKAFNAEGRSLAIALKAFVGRNTEVVFEPETQDGRLGSSQEIQIPEPGA
jgi:hypothetical protein